MISEKKLESTFIIAKAGNPRLKNKELEQNLKPNLSNCPYPNSADIISFEPINKAIDAGKLKNRLNSSFILN